MRTADFSNDGTELVDVLLLRKRIYPVQNAVLLKCVIPLVGWD